LQIFAIFFPLYQDILKGRLFWFLISAALVLPLNALKAVLEERYGHLLI